jgi:molybdopterin synthase catalytic subunit
MHIDVTITHHPLEQLPWPTSLHGLAGAHAQFTGLVRATENDQPISALVYEAYQPMAENLVRQIIHDIAKLHPCLYVRVLHRIGIVPVGQAAILVAAAAAHRAEALAMVTLFMDRLKQDVPIWKCHAVTQIDPVTSLPS